MRWVTGLAVFAFSLIPGVALAQDEVKTEPPSTVRVVGSNTDFPSSVFFQLADRVNSAECFFGLISVDISTEVGRAQHAQILSAHARRSLVTVTYVRTESECLLKVLSIE